MNIIFIAGNWGGPPNGIDRYIMDLTRNLVQQGHTCRLIYSRLKGAWLSKDIPFAENRQVRGLYEHPTTDNRTAPNLLLQAIRPMNPDVIYFHTFNHHEALAAVLSNYPTIGMLHDYLPVCLKDTRRFYFSPHLCQAPLGLTCLLRGHFIRKPSAGHFLPHLVGLTNARKLVAVLKTMPALIVASQAVKNAYLQNGFLESRLRLLPLYTNVPQLEIKASYPREKSVLFVGRLTDRYKGADYLLKAIKHCQETFQVDIAGDGAYLKTVRHLADKLKLTNRVRFHGWINAEEVHTLYRKASAVIMPSLWAEPFGLVGLEALANGTPVVAFDAGGVSEWLQDGRNGFLVPFLDQKILAEKIDLLVATPDLVKSLGMAGRKIVRENFSADKYMVQLVKLFNECRENRISGLK